MIEKRDEFGFVKEGEYLLVIIPALNGALPLRIEEIENKGARRLNYGPIPVTIEDHATGVVPANTVTSEFTFEDITKRYPLERAADMFFFTKATKLVHAFIDIRPHLFRVERLIPPGTHQYSFMDLITSSVERHMDFGYITGITEQIFLPGFHINWQLANETSMDLYTYTTIEYAEYTTTLITSADLIHDLIVGEIPAYRYTFPAWTVFDELTRMVTEIYNMKKLIPLYPTGEREMALKEIPSIFERAKEFGEVI